MASPGVAEWLVRWRKMLQNADIPKMYHKLYKLNCQKSLKHPKCSWRCEEPKAAKAKETRATGRVIQRTNVFHMSYGRTDMIAGNRRSGTAFRFVYVRVYVCAYNQMNSPSVPHFLKIKDWVSGSLTCPSVCKTLQSFSTATSTSLHFRFQHFAAAILDVSVTGNSSAEKDPIALLWLEAKMSLALLFLDLLIEMLEKK